MSFFAILLALMLDQAKPLGRHNPIHEGMRSWARWTRQTLDAGQSHHGWLTWALAVLGPALAAAVVYGVLWAIHGLLAFVWLTFTLYLTLGFRQFSHHFTAIRVALESGDEAGARAALARWKGGEVAELPREELLRQAIEHAVVAAHRHVFGVLVCFVVLAAFGLGPAGAVLYRMAEHVSRRWQQTAPMAGDSDASRQAALTGWHWIDFLPVRVTALAFAVVGNFEEAIANWRQERPASAGNDAVLLAATAGAINVRLGGQLAGAGSADDAGWEGASSRAPQLAHLASVVGLVWRSVLLWLLLLALGMLARFW
ncbi:CobD/CbiB family protein [Tepidicella baoligensis]|uniref:CobD/CbiB family protein n=1 Tax=Tepidicella baoligensis TaxID=2707016 RepID=UPI0015DAE5A9|nr:CobD/CbiB family protein [Tepidicella baoligensis]